MPSTNQPPATPASDAQCPKCGAAYVDTSLRWVTDEIHRGQSKLYFDAFECGTNVYGTTLGLTQSDPCRIRELTAEVARLQAALAESESQTQHFRESYAEQVQEVDRLEQAIAVERERAANICSRRATNLFDQAMDENTATRDGEVMEEIACGLNLAANEIRSVTP